MFLIFPSRSLLQQAYFHKSQGPSQQPFVNCASGQFSQPCWQEASVATNLGDLYASPKARDDVCKWWYLAFLLSSKTLAYFFWGAGGGKSQRDSVHLLSDGINIFAHQYRTWAALTIFQTNAHTHTLECHSAWEQRRFASLTWPFLPLPGLAVATNPITEKGKPTL